jgi:hypothetical protein
MPARRTAGCDPGLWDVELISSLEPPVPTPRKSDGERGGRGDLIQVLRGNKSNSSHKPRVPTPTASDGGPDHNKVSRTGLNLPGAVAAFQIPTPTRQDYGLNRGGAAGRMGQTRPSLRSLLLTPTAKGNTASPAMSKWPAGAAMQDMLAQIDQAGGG